MKWIYVSPHLDDVVYSCGGIIWEQRHRGDAVEVWTLATADANPATLSSFARDLHQRWQSGENPMQIRREEDIRAMRELGCSYQHLGFDDCIYRVNEQTGTALIQRNEDLFPLEYRPEPSLIDRMRSTFLELITRRTDTTHPFRLVAPLGVGGHVDHRNARLACEKCGLPLYSYADYPYAAGETETLTAYLPVGVSPEIHTLSQPALIAWQAGIACYTSQISTFWNSLEEMKMDVAVYAEHPTARTFWR